MHILMEGCNSTTLLAPDAAFPAFPIKTLSIFKTFHLAVLVSL